MSNRQAPIRRGEDIRQDAPGYPNPALSSLAQAFLQLPLGAYAKCADFIRQHPGIVRESQSLLVQASLFQREGKTKLAQTCVHHTLLLRKFLESNERDAEAAIKRLEQGGEDTTRFINDIKTVLAKLPSGKQSDSSERLPPDRTTQGRPIQDRTVQNRPEVTNRRESSQTSRDDMGTRYDDTADRVKADLRGSNTQHEYDARAGKHDDFNAGEHSRETSEQTERARPYRGESASEVGRLPTQGDLETLYKTYFLPDADISETVIARDIKQYGGPQATARRVRRQDGRTGYEVSAEKALTTQDIAKLKQASIRYGRDRHTQSSARPAASKMGEDTNRYAPDDLASDLRNFTIGENDQVNLARQRIPASVVSSINTSQRGPQGVPDERSREPQKEGYYLEAEVGRHQDCQHKRVDAYLDSGSQVTIIKQDYFQKLPGESDTRRASKLLRAFNGKDMGVAYETDLHITWKGGPLIHTVAFICKTLPTDLLIGVQVIQDYRLLTPTKGIRYAARENEPANSRPPVKPTTDLRVGQIQAYPKDTRQEGQPTEDVYVGLISAESRKRSSSGQAGDSLRKTCSKCGKSTLKCDCLKPGKRPPDRHE